MGQKAHNRKSRSAKRRIAPRLEDGTCRVGIGHGLPPEVKEGVRAIARAEGQSVSWVLEQVIIDYFGLKKPRYEKRRKEE